MTDWIKTAYVGQKVVCVDDREGAFSEPNVEYVDDSLDGLSEGVVYTIRYVGLDDDPVTPLDIIVIKVNEIHRPLYNGFEQGYSYERFKPLIDRPMDISVFTELLRDMEHA